MVVGTLAYIAPELLRRHPHTEKVDYWSLGIIAYKMAFACFPWDVPLRSECRDFVDACDRYVAIIDGEELLFPEDADDVRALSHLLPC